MWIPNKRKHEQIKKEYTQVDHQIWKREKITKGDISQVLSIRCETQSYG